MAKRFAHVGVSCLSLAVAACGGGSGGGGTTNSTPPPPAIPVSLPNPMPAPSTNPTSENFDTAEYRNSSAAIGSNAIGAWQHGATGKGVTIGFIDTGLVPTLSDFEGRISPASKDFYGDRPMGDVWGHGTAVAGIAAAAHDGSGMEGIAFESTIFMAKADTGCPDNCTFPSSAVARGIDGARLAGAKVINLSVGGDSNGEILDAAKRAINAGIVLVIGAGNSGASAPSELARELGKLAPNQVIIVGALGVSNADGSINYDLPAKWTTAAGETQTYFLTAPGWLNSATYFRGGGIDKLSGTSFAAPVVSGAVALLAQAFPMLTPQQLVQLLYVTADDLGPVSTDATFGRGRLNIGRAFLPVGTVRLANSMAPVPNTIGSLPVAAGDAAKRGSLKATVLDDFKRPFEMDLAATFVQLVDAGPLYRSLIPGKYNYISAPVGPISLAFTVREPTRQRGALDNLHLTREDERSARLLAAKVTAKLTSNLSFGFGIGVSSSTLRDSFRQRGHTDFLLTEQASTATGVSGRRPMSLVIHQRLGGWQLSATAERGSIPAVKLRAPDANYSSASVHIGREWRQGALGFAITWLNEPDTTLGGRLDSLFGQHGSQSWFVDVDGNHSLGSGWSFAVAARRGWTTLPSGRFATSSYSFDLFKEGALSSDDVIKVRISQPLRVERGGLGLTLPVGWEYKTETVTEAFRQLHLVPSGREHALEFGYLRHFARGSYSLHLFHRTDPGHFDDRKSDVGGAMRLDISL